MQSLKIETGDIRLSINDDPNRIITFNPSDVLFAERFYILIGEFQQKLVEYANRYEELASDDGRGEDGLPHNTPERVALLKETCVFIRAKIDYLFGVGTSSTAFGDAMSLDMFNQFFEGITPFVQSKRVSKVNQYVSPKGNKGKRRK